MDFRELTYITTIADCGSVTEAAKRLYISQPSLSYILGKVEEDLSQNPLQNLLQTASSSRLFKMEHHSNYAPCIRAVGAP